MANENETVEIEGQTSENATLLLAAAEELDLPADVVRTSGSGFIVPKEVAEKAGLEPVQRESLEETLEREQREAKEREDAVETDLGSFSAEGEDADTSAKRRSARKSAAKKADAEDKE